MKVGDALDAIKEMIKAIILAVDKKIATAKFDRTVRGRITDVLSKNRYKVSINGQIYTVKSKSQHTVHDIVNVMIPQNNTNEMFIIADGFVKDGSSDTPPYIHPDTHSLDMITETTDKKIMTTGERNKLTNIETGAEVNNISDVDATDLTDKGDTTLHYHSADRNRENHTGLQPSSTISDFASTVRGTALTGLSTITNIAISATDTVLSALGKLQKQISDNLTTLINHINNKSNPHTVTKNQIGLDQVDNTSDINKPISLATQTALNNKSNTDHIHDYISNSEKGTANGIATLGSDGIIASNQLPNNLKEIKVVNTINDRDTLTQFEGLRVHVIDATSDISVSSGWAEYLSNGSTWIKTAENESIDVSLDWNNISGKPTTFTPATHNHNSLYEPKNTNIQAHISDKLNPHNITKSQVGLENVDNTNDLDKPISNATQSALGLKANIDNPSFTGTPIAPTALKGTNSTQIATTAFVQQEMSNAGLGDMLKSVYDADNDGVVDKSDIATKLDVPRNINGVAFDGSADIIITANPDYHTHSKNEITDFPQSLPADGGNSSTVNGHTVNADVPSGAKFTDTVYTHPSTHPASMITGLPTSLPANGGNADTAKGLIGDDTRSINSAPSEYMSGGSRYINRAGWQTEFKYISTIGAGSFLTGTYCYLETKTPWSDPSGGYPIQIAYGAGRPCWRVGTSNTTWNSWSGFADGGNANTVDGKHASAFANSSHTHPASQVSSGTLPVGVKATNSTDYTTSRLRNAQFGTTIPTSLNNGEIYYLYE